MTAHTRTPRHSRNAASAGGAAPLQNRPRDYQPCGTPRNHAEEIANARYAGNSPEGDDMPSRNPFLYMVQDFEGGTLARATPPERRMPPGTGILIALCVTVGLAVWWAL